ncbi:hypothetical protein [Pseudodesulfovibrio methanolicus]|uniref:Nitrogen regulatory protein P-II n=1 Tax=Pseudodesulfovibrio methanolicus TaxID=3126690 RepID=A0ABZ2IW84_9BACT
MRLAVIIKAEQKEVLPTAAELREAGFAVSSAMGPGRGAAGACGPARRRCGSDEPDKAAPERAGPVCRCLTERQRP